MTNPYVSVNYVEGFNKVMDREIHLYILKALSFSLMKANVMYSRYLGEIFMLILRNVEKFPTNFCDTNIVENI